MPLYDAHCHLQDAQLAGAWSDLERQYRELGVAGVVVNGTREADWDAVAELVDRFEWALPSFGLHPWFAREASGKWFERLEGFLARFPRAGIGEIGLDRWIKGHDLAVQREAFVRQLRLAKDLDRALSLHCLQAWGPLYHTLREESLPGRGFLIHSYGGPAEMIPAFAKLEARFSVSAYFAWERKANQREALRQIPLDRLLIETDAPDMLGPLSARPYPLVGTQGQEINHPANLVATYDFAAQLIGIERRELEEIVEENWLHLFG